MATLRAFTHSRRLKILKSLMHLRVATCDEIVTQVHISQPAVSRHLVTLLNAGLVRVTENREWKLAPKSSLSLLARTLLDAAVKA